MARRATTSVVDSESSSRDTAARTHSAQMLRAAPTALAASGSVLALSLLVSCPVRVAAHPHSAAAAASAAISPIRFLRFMVVSRCLTDLEALSVQLAEGGRQRIAGIFSVRGSILEGQLVGDAQTILQRVILSDDPGR